MTKRVEYIFTHHLRERFVQRTNSQYDHLKVCREKDCEVCQELQSDIELKVAENSKEINTQIAKHLDKSEENRSYLNNSGFMAWYYDKYGYDTQFQFLIHNNILFVVLIKKERKVVVTCLDARTHLAGKVATRKKYNKIPTKEEKNQAKLLERLEKEAQLS